mgnify:CR=1 FL=1
MCDPVSAGMAVMGVAQASAGASAANKQYKAQAAHAQALGIHRNAEFYRQVAYQEELAEWQEEMYNKTANEAQESASGQYAALLERLDQVKSRTLQGISKAGRQARQGSAFVRAAAAESGTVGNSVLLAQQQYELAEARSSVAGFENLRSEIKQSQRNLAGIQSQAQNLVNRAMPPPMSPINPAAPVQAVSRPSMAPYMIQAGSAGLNAAAHQEMINAINPMGDPPT